MLAFGVLAAVSCVNKEYDLAKPIDTTMNVGGQFEIPVPGKSEYSYTLGEIILPEGSAADGMVRKQDDGSFLFFVEPDAGLSESYDFPTIEANDYGKTVEYPAGDNYCIAPGPGTSFPAPSVSVAVSIPFDLTISGIDASVEAIKEVSLDAGLKLSLETTTGGVVFILKDGFTFTLPEWMYVDGASLPSCAELSGTNVIKIKGDQTANPAFAFECRLNKLDLSAFDLKGSADGKEIATDGGASAKGEVELKSSSLPSGTKFKLRTAAEISNIKAKSVTLKASPVLDCDPQEIRIGETPKAFTDGSLSFELEDIHFYVTATNGTPFDFTLTSEISASSSKGQKKAVIEEKDGFTIDAEAGNQLFCISESGKYGDGAKKIAVKGLAGLISPVPEKILLSNTTAHGGSEDYVTLDADKNYEVGLSYRIEAPFAFKSLTLNRDETVDLNVNLGDDVGFSDLFIKADFKSTLPLNANLTFTLADSDGNALKDITLKYEDENGAEIGGLALPAAGLSAPSSKVMKLIIAVAKGKHIAKLEKLQIHIEASSPEGEVAVLNEKQAISISGITVGTTEGIHIKN